MFPINLKGILLQALRDSNRPPDGLLHPSGDLLGSLRHTMLAVAGAPTIDSKDVQAIRLQTGTLWHEWTRAQLIDAGIPFMQEVKLNPWLPRGWGGTADWVFWEPELRGFVLGDKKTIKGEGMRWILKDGAKDEHVWQTSMYWHALYDSGLPMVTGIGILYWPMNDTQDRSEVVSPEIMDFDPLPRDQVHNHALNRTAQVEEYLNSLPWKPALGMPPRYPDEVMQNPPAYFLTGALASEQDRVQKVIWSKQQGVFDVKLCPHWSAEFCPFPPELCGCSRQGTTKIGHYTLEGTYMPRKGYEDVWALVEPSEKEYKRQRELAAKDEPKDTLEADLKKTLEEHAAHAGA